MPLNEEKAEHLREQIEELQAKCEVAADAETSDGSGLARSATRGNADDEAGREAESAREAETAVGADGPGVYNKQ